MDVQLKMSVEVSALSFFNLVPSADSIMVSLKRFLAVLFPDAGEPLYVNIGLADHVSHDALSFPPENSAARPIQNTVLGWDLLCQASALATWSNHSALRIRSYDLCRNA